MLHPVAPGVLVATSRRDATNSVVVRRRPGSPDVLVVDPAWTPDELARLGRALLGTHVVAGLSTHAHFDHLLWHPSLGRARRWASPPTVARARDGRAALLAELGPGYPRAVIASFGAVLPVSGALLWDGIPVELIAHDAHEPGSLAVWLPAQRVLLAGDLLSDREPPLLGEGDALQALADYRAGLQRLRPLVARAALVVPGHGTPGTDAPARLEADLRYLDALEAGRPRTDRRLRDPAMAAADRRAAARLSSSGTAG